MKLLVLRSWVNAPASRTIVLFGIATLGISILLFFIAAAVLPVSGYDGATQLIWIPSFRSLLDSGSMIPRWLPNSFNGLGSPTFYFYPPLAYYLCSALSAVTTISETRLLHNLVAVLACIGSIPFVVLLLKELGADSRAAFPCCVRRGCDHHHVPDRAGVFIQAALAGFQPDESCDRIQEDIFHPHAL